MVTMPGIDSGLIGTVGNRLLQHLDRLIILHFERDAKDGVDVEILVVDQGHMSLGDSLLDAECQASLDRRLTLHTTLCTLDAIRTTAAGEVEAVIVPKDSRWAVRSRARGRVIERRVVLVRLVKRNRKRDRKHLGRYNSDRDNILDNLGDFLRGTLNPASHFLCQVSACAS